MSVLQERRKYDKIGWNISYDFSESDFTVSVQILFNYLNKTQNEGPETPLPWDTLRYLIGKVMYGGRVIDAYDQRIIDTLMEEYFGDFVFDEYLTFYFYQDQKFQYNVPTAQTREEYLGQLRV